MLFKKKNIWFWQSFVSPHLAYLVEATASLNTKVFYVVNNLVTQDRKLMGWNLTKLSKAKLVIKRNKHSLKNLTSYCDVNQIHIMQGLRGNGLLHFVQKIFLKKNINFWVIVENIDETLVNATVKRIIYRLLFYLYRKNINGILAIGDKSVNWCIERGFESNKIYPFAYFLSDNISRTKRTRNNSSVFRFIFVGQLIERKRLDFLIKALSLLFCRIDFELVVIGDGPLRDNLKILANNLLPGRVHWLGTLPINKVPEKIANADCLVLPSRHDGWGSVITESLMVGTQVICSDGCGALEVLKDNRSGGFFKRIILINFHQFF
jgi:glycosyltransferase involved in cell wall biosynthesis